MVHFLSIWDSVSQHRQVKKVVGNGITTSFSVMTILYFFIQVSILIATLDTSHATVETLGSVFKVAKHDVNRGFTYIDSNKGGKVLRSCSQGIASASLIDLCPIVFPLEGEAAPVATSVEPSFQTQPTKRDGAPSTMVPIFQGDNLTSLLIVGADDVVTLSPVCLRVLEWPLQTLAQTRRDDITTVMYQVWLLVLSIIAIFTESIPLIWASLAMHVLSLVQSSLRLFFTIAFKVDYQSTVTSAHGACDGIDFLRDYFKTRGAFEIASIVSDFVALLLSTYLTWRLASKYGLNSFKQLTASRRVRTGYLVTLSLFTVIPLVFFFHIAGIALWLEEITSHIMGARPSHLSVNLALNILSAIFVIPWLGLAFFGVRR